MACPRCGQSRPPRQVPPPTASRPGGMIPNPAQNRPQPSNAGGQNVRDAITGLRYVPTTK